VTDALDLLKTAHLESNVFKRELGAGGMATVYLAPQPRARAGWSHSRFCAPSSPSCGAECVVNAVAASDRFRGLTEYP
jgi:hypothetical protein